MPAEVRVKVTFEISKPATAQLKFETKEQAEEYGKSIKDRKPFVKTSDVSVRFVLPASVRTVYWSQSFKGFVLTFEPPEEAAHWTDPICKSIPNKSGLVVIQQYWDPGELEAALSSAGKKDQRGDGPSAPRTKLPPPKQRPSGSSRRTRHEEVG
ncbi:hypothetical protein MAPG_11741 [Magnaporthiopsis poae ATCC 64411]|uniref:Uncharacterized protein n=1 Tax=Magnaporthiopsis poae (strain ATCC 64411 / 73-15) TaxID=644358 RepID=A0A0C4EG26_MAGP6|nr:hypothetical protein MAPG_11741 [Magnaporthiopsis poae ATCC 64411]